MSWWARVFGAGFDPDSVPVTPVVALPYTVVPFAGGRVVIRFWYSPDPRRADDAAAIHRAMLNGMADSYFRQRYADAEYSRFGVYSAKVPHEISGPVALWMRDVSFRRSKLPGDFLAKPGMIPFWLRFDLPRKIRWDVVPADSPGGRARQRIDRTRRRGGVAVRAALIQANYALFQPGSDDLPCLVLFTFDDRVGDEELLAVAGRVSALKNTTPADRDLAFVAGLTTDETFIYYRRDLLPRSFAGRTEFYVTHLHVHRPFLRHRYLVERVLDCIAEPGERGMLELLPFSPTA